MASATLFLIGPVNLEDKRWSRYDIKLRHIIRAQTENAVRQIAADACADEGRQVWLDPALTKVTPLDIYGTPGIIMTEDSFI